MSWEGYAETLCAKGHLSSHDELSCMYSPGSHWKHANCEVCNAPIIAVGIVDTTNGCDFVNGNHAKDCYPCKGKLRVEVKKPAVYCTCKECGISHIVNETLYKLMDG